MFVEYLSALLNRVYKVPAPVDPERTFQELELDSLSLAELGAQLEDDLGVTIEEEELTSDTTVAALSELLEGRGASLAV